MNAIPLKVFVVLGAESGVFVAFGVMLYFTVRTMRQITVTGRWQDFRRID